MSLHDQENQSLQERFLTDLEIAARYGVARITPWRWARNGDFPAPVKLGLNCTRWRLSDVLTWEGAGQEDARKPDESTIRKLIGTSASDCAISLSLRAEREPAGLLSEVTAALVWMNAEGVEKKAHRQALMKAGRMALKKLGEM